MFKKIKNFLNKNYKKVAIIGALGLLLSSGLAYADRTDTNPFYLDSNGINWITNDPLYELGSSANRIAKIWATAIDTTTITVGGATPFTQGSVVFVGASGVFAQDNTNFFWDDTNNQLVLGVGSATLPSYTFTADTNTGIFNINPDILGFSTGGNEAARFDASRRLLIGVTTARAIGASTAQLEIEGTNANTSSFSITRNSADGSSSIITLGKSRGTTVGAFDAVTSGDSLGAIAWAGADGTNLASRAGQIAMEPSGTVSTGIVPGLMRFFTTNSAGTLGEKMRIMPTGLIGINTTAPVALLDISTNTAFSGTPSASGSYLGMGTNGGVYTDTATAGSGTAAAFKIAVIGQVSLAATNSTVTTTLATGLAIQGAPRAHTNQTITTSIGLEVLSSNSVANAGTVGTAIGMRVVAPTGATNNYNFVATGAGFSSFGTATPVSFLMVAPSATVNALPSAVGTFLSVGTVNRGLNDNTTAAAGTLARATFSSFEQGIFLADNAITAATDVATVSVNGAPRGGTNGNITNSIALLVSGTNSLTNATTPTNGFGLVVSQTTGATNNYTARFDIGTATSTTNNITLKSARAALVATNVIAGIGFMSDDTTLTAPGTNTALIRTIATETHTATNLGTDMRFSITANATAAPLEALRLVGAATAVNNLQITNSATTTNPILGVQGSDANIGLDLQVKAAAVTRLMGTSSNAGTLRFMEDTDDGTNYSEFLVGAQAGNLTYTWPTAAPVANGYGLTATTAGVMSWSPVPTTLSGSATLNFGSTAAGASTDLTVTVTGAADGDVCTVGVPNGSITANGVFWCWVSATNTVTVRYTNTNLVAAADPASGTFKVKVLQ